MIVIIALMAMCVCCIIISSLSGGGGYYMYSKDDDTDTTATKKDTKSSTQSDTKTTLPPIVSEPISGTKPQININNCYGPDISKYNDIGKSSITSPFKMKQCDAMFSPNRKYMFVLGTDGAPMVYNTEMGTILWNSNHFNRGPRPYSMELQSDGNLVKKSADPNILWATNHYDLSLASGPFKLRLANDGHLIETDKNDANFWSSDKYE